MALNIPANTTLDKQSCFLYYNIIIIWQNKHRSVERVTILIHAYALLRHAVVSSPVLWLFLFVKATRAYTRI